MIFVTMTDRTVIVKQDDLSPKLNRVTVVEKTTTVETITIPKAVGKWNFLLSRILYFSELKEKILQLKPRMTRLRSILAHKGPVTL